MKYFFPVENSHFGRPETILVVLKSEKKKEKKKKEEKKRKENEKEEKKRSSPHFVTFPPSILNFPPFPVKSLWRHSASCPPRTTSFLMPIPDSTMLIILFHVVLYSPFFWWEYVLVEMVGLWQFPLGFPVTTGLPINFRKKKEMKWTLLDRNVRSHIVYCMG